MQRTIAPYLKSTYELIRCTFPDGIEAEAYFPLLVILYEEMSVAEGTLCARNLAEVVAYHTGKAYDEILNDIYLLASSSPPSSDVMAKIKYRLSVCGYEQWLNED